MPFLFLFGNLFAQFHLSRFFGTFFFYEFVIRSKCTFTHRIRCYISMPFGFWEVKITRRCVLMNVRSNFSLATLYTLFCRCNFLCLPLNYSNAMSIEFQIEQNAISICTCHFIYEKRELHTTQNDEKISGNFDYLSRFVSIFLTFSRDWLDIRSHLPALYFNFSFVLMLFIFHWNYFFFSTLQFEVDWLHRMAKNSQEINVNKTMNGGEQKQTR